MPTSRIEVFFSCSFADEDKSVNDFFQAICKALNLSISNVSTGSAHTPPEAAKLKIENSQALIAICTRRDELKSGGFVMPEAIHDEISFSIGKDIPVLMIVENGVSLKGFKQNFGTQLAFDRNELADPTFLHKAIEAIYDLKNMVLSQVNPDSWHTANEAYADYLNHLVELVHTPDGFLWHYTGSKKLTYTQASRRPIPSGYWATNVIIPSTAKPISWSVSLDNASNDITMDVIIEKQTSDSVEAIIKLTPPPASGDFIEYTVSAESRYLNPVWSDEAPDGMFAAHLSDGNFICADGLIFLHRTKRAVIEFRFAKESRITSSDIRPFVASHTSSIDFEVASELARVHKTTYSFGGNVVVRLEVDSPLPAHMYGVAWNPRKRPLVK